KNAPFDIVTCELPTTYSGIAAPPPWPPVPGPPPKPAQPFAPASPHQNVVLVCVHVVESNPPPSNVGPSGKPVSSELPSSCVPPSIVNWSGLRRGGAASREAGRR